MAYLLESELQILRTMKFVLFPLLSVAALYAQSLQPAPAAANDEQSQEESTGELNVNSRYTIESISFAGEHHYKLSSSLMEEMQRLIGSKLNSEALNRLSQRISSELRAHDVTFKLVRGRESDCIRVLLEVKQRENRFDVSVPKFVYNSRQGWTGATDATTTVGANAFTFGLLSDGDTLTERFTGFQTRYARTSLGSDRIRLGFEFDGYHQMYNGATLDALERNSSSSLGAGAYRSRLNFEPSATFVLAKPLTLTVGMSFEQLEPQATAARSESANAVINTLRYHQRWEDSGATTEELEAGYSLRAATKFLGTDLHYTRHLANLRYFYSHERQSVEVTVAAGLILGRAPLFERFVLGNSSTLRGWNKYDLDPLGGNRLAYGSVTYGYRVVRVFYDTGAIWDQGNAPEAKHSIGVGVSSGLGRFEKGTFLLAVAFPIRQGRADPVLIAGMNF